jgi:hypothetical protein
VWRNEQKIEKRKKERKKEKGQKGRKADRQTNGDSRSSIAAFKFFSLNVFLPSFSLSVIAFFLSFSFI